MKKTIKDLKAMDKPFFTPDDIAGVLGTTAHAIRCTARQHPELIGFEFTFCGNRMKIPRIPFLRFMGVNIYGETKDEQ